MCLMHGRRARCQGKITSGSTSLFKLRWILFMLQRPIKGHSKYNNWVCECAACVYMRDVTLYISISLVYKIVSSGKLSGPVDMQHDHLRKPNSFLCVCLHFWPLLSLLLFETYTPPPLILLDTQQIHTPKALCETTSYAFSHADAHMA